MGEKINDNDTKEICASFIKTYGFLHHVKTSMDHFYSVGLPNIIIKQFKVDRKFSNCIKRGTEWTLKSGDLQYIHLLIYATKVVLHKPTIYIDKEVPSYPNQCKKKGTIYGGQLEITYHIELKGKRKDDGTIIEKTPVDYVAKVGKLPIVLKSNHCNIENATPRELDLLKENPNEDGGYIVNGDNCYIIDSIERTNAFNRINTYYEDKHHQNILAFSNIISKPGINYENSFESKVFVKSTGEISIVVNQDIFMAKEIPFFVFFRLYGMTSDLDIFKLITKTEKVDANISLFTYIYNGFMNVNPIYSELKNEYELEEIKSKLASILEKRANKFRVNLEILNILDQYLLPHVGTEPKHRFNKLVFLGTMIKKTLLVVINPKLATNRDYLEEKLVQPPGVLFGDTIKTLYNKHINAKLEAKFEEKVKTANFENIDILDTFKSVVNDTKLESKLITTLSSGNGDKDNVDSRYSTQKLYTTPEVSTKNAARTVRVAKSSAHGKKSRSNAVREARASYATYLDMTMTHDTGGNVGKIKGLALYVIITVAGDLSLEERLLTDIEPLDQNTFCLSNIEGKGEVHFNGKPLGYVQNIFLLYEAYVKLRRERKIDRFVGIHVQAELNIIDFRTDSSRLSRPFLVVKNNKIGYTIDHHVQLVAGKININDLINEGILEWIDNREFVYTTYVANSLETLYAHEHSRTERFTHCDFPSALYGIACISQPFAAHNPETRTAFQAKMVKQSLGVPTFEREPFYSDVWRQNMNSAPICATILSRFVAFSGRMINLAIMPYRGHNQEDSLIISQRLADWGIFHATVDKIIEEKIVTGEFIAPLDEENTDTIKSGNYGKLKGGLIMKGVIVEPGDILICKKVANRKSEDDVKRKKFNDKSLTYTGKNPVLIVDVLEISNSHGRFIKILTREERPVREGDKLSCYTPDHQMLTTEGWVDVANITKKHKVACMDDDGILMYRRPKRIIEGDADNEEIYIVESNQVNLSVTMNHRMYVRTRPTGSKFKIAEAGTLLHKERKYKKNVAKWIPERECTVAAFSELTYKGRGGGLKTLPRKELPIGDWCTFYGIWIAEGCADVGRTFIAANKERVKKEVMRILDEHKIRYTFYNNESGEPTRMYIWDKQINEYLCRQSVGAINKYLDKWVWRLSRENCEKLMRGMILGDGHENKSVNAKTSSYRYDTSSVRLANDFQRLCLHAGFSTNITLKELAGTVRAPIKEGGKNIVTNANAWRMSVITVQNEPLVNKHDNKKWSDRIERYTGKVHCVEVPGKGLVYVRRNGIPVWSGNSVHGQKGIISKIYPAHLMPFTKDGIIPDIIMNPHGYPTRKSLGQLIECLYSKIGGYLGRIEDYTAFTPINLYEKFEEAEKLGLSDLETLFDGVTGRKYENSVLLCPCYYQRIHKSIYDSHYANYYASKDAKTRQAQNGQKRGGGIKFGELEFHACADSGAGAQIRELSTTNSDPFVVYGCRCGSKEVIVNEVQGIFDCMRCNAPSIVKLSSSFTSNLLNNELTCMNVGMTYEYA